MRKLKQLLLIGVVGALFALTGCAHLTVPVKPEGKQVEIEKGKALVVVYLDNQGSNKPVLILDNKELKTIVQFHARKTYFQIEPGKHTIAATANNNLPLGGFDFIFFEGEVEAGQVYYIAAGTYENFFTGTHVTAKNTSMKDALTEKGDHILTWLLFDDLYELAPDGFTYYGDDKESISERYDEQLKDARADGEVIQLKASPPNPTKVKLHNGKYL